MKRLGPAGIVTSTIILDGTILNADVNASAAIAGTKISPDFGAQTIVTTGVHSAAAGSAAAPSITFTGDLNTGIYSPGADQVAISTNGTGRITVDGSGNVNIDSNTVYVDAANNRVGFGTSSPSFITHISTGDASSITEPTAGSFGLYIQQNTSGSKGGLCIQDGASNSGPALKVVDNTNSTRFIIDADGNVGIGTNPAYQLQVSTDSAGKPSSALWTIVSDERIKEDIELADLDLCYEAIKAIPLKRYKWRDDIYTAEQVTDRRKLGWIAQDVEAIFPKAVGTHEFKYNQVFEETIIPAVEEELDADGNVITPAQPERIERGDLISEDVIEDCRDLNSDQLYAAMYGAIQKLMVKVETLETEVALLKATGVPWTTVAAE